jgi:hypothetical protein
MESQWDFVTLSKQVMLNQMLYITIAKSKS